MCFYKDPRHWVVKTATRDMICYKGIVVSPYMEGLFGIYRRKYQYTLNKVLKSRLESNNNIRLIYKGFHSYSSKSKMQSRRRDLFAEHSYVKIFVCIIPAGSKYFWNPEHEEYVSNRLIVTNEIINSKGVSTSLKRLKVLNGN